jgi:Cu-processing system permease protein
MIARQIKYVLADILRGRIVIGYALFLFLASFGVFNLAGDQPKGLVGLLSLALIVVPLVSVVFSVAHYYNSSSCWPRSPCRVLASCWPR